MTCSEFDELHTDLLDEALSDADLMRAQLHLAECRRCSDLDSAVRRALLVFRNLPPIEPSRQFSRRLNSRLAAERGFIAASVSRISTPIAGAFAFAAGVLLVALFAGNRFSQQYTPTLPPVVASHSEPQVSDVVGPAIAASMSAGFPVWPAVFMIERASEQLANAEYQFTSYTPR